MPCGKTSWEPPPFGGGNGVPEQANMPSPPPAGQSQARGAVRRRPARRFSYTNWVRTMRLIWSAAPGWTIAWAVLLVAQGLLPAAVIYLTKLSIDALIAAKDAGADAGMIRHAAVLLALLAGSM